MPAYEGRAETQMRRQAFYVHQWGYDTHGSQLSIHNTLLGDLSKAVKAFEDSMDALGIGNRVTLFTLSDFGRALNPASNNGTDHGWGNYAFVAGGAVKGGDFYGTVPTIALKGPTTWAMRAGGFPRRRSTNTARRFAAGSALPKATCRTSSRASAHSRTPTWGS